MQTIQVTIRGQPGRMRAAGKKPTIQVNWLMPHASDDNASSSASEDTDAESADKIEASVDDGSRV
jgi:hypothetical protein